MEDILSYLIPAAIVALLILIVWKVGSWAISDAQLRGKSPFLVFLAVIFFFPWGLIAWLIFRPEPPQPPFDLRRFRQQ
jgi:hypothetical protein